MQLPGITMVSWKCSRLWARLGIAHCCTQVVYFGGPIVTAGIFSEPAWLQVGAGRARDGSCSREQHLNSTAHVCQNWTCSPGSAFPSGDLWGLCSLGQTLGGPHALPGPPGQELVLWRLCEPRAGLCWLPPELDMVLHWQERPSLWNPTLDLTDFHQALVLLFCWTCLRFWHPEIRSQVLGCAFVFRIEKRKNWFSKGKFIGFSLLWERSKLLVCSERKYFFCF